MTNALVVPVDDHHDLNGVQQAPRSGAAALPNTPLPPRVPYSLTLMVAMHPTKRTVKENLFRIVHGRRLLRRDGTADGAIVNCVSTSES